jgi:hypothetical protein
MRSMSPDPLLSRGLALRQLFKSPPFPSGCRFGPSRSMGFLKLLPLSLTLSLSLIGCARFPANGGGQTTRVIFTMTTAEPINPNYVYLVAIHPSVDVNPTTQGPVPVISQPWGNGFVAGTVDLFVRWDPLTSPNYLIYRFQDVNLTQFIQVGVPINSIPVNTGDNRIQFELDINQIASNEAQVPLLQSLQVNFLTMNRVPQGSDPGSKVYDALGDTQDPAHINDFVEIPLLAGTYDNARFANMEPAGDTPDPALDITNWSVEVRTP